MEYVREAWDDTEWLSRTDDPHLLRETGRALARSLLDEADPAREDAYHGLRGAGTDVPDRLRSLVRRRLNDLDRVAGAAVQAVGARLNHAVRSRFGPGTTRFLGDVLVYQRHRNAIQARVRQVIDGVDPDLGRTAARPVRIAAHSLGGVIAVDMATATRPLWTESLVTFGSQAAFFHICDPRGGQRTPYGGSMPVHLPPSLNRWTNLREPMDVLAFAASKVFQLHDGTAPVDLPTEVGPVSTNSARRTTSSESGPAPVNAKAGLTALRRRVPRPSDHERAAAWASIPSGRRYGNGARTTSLAYPVHGIPAARAATL